MAFSLKSSSSFASIFSSGVDGRSVLSSCDDSNLSSSASGAGSEMTDCFSSRRAARVSGSSIEGASFLGLVRVESSAIFVSRLFSSVEFGFSFASFLFFFFATVSQHSARERGMHRKRLEMRG